MLYEFFFLIFKIALFVFLRELKRGEGQREGDRGSEAGYALSACGLEPANRETMTWDKVRHLTDWAPRVPLYELFCDSLLSLNVMFTTFHVGYCWFFMAVQCSIRRLFHYLFISLFTGGHFLEEVTGAQHRAQSQTVRWWPEPKSKIRCSTNRAPQVP